MQDTCDLVELGFETIQVAFTCDTEEDLHASSPLMASGERDHQLRLCSSSPNSTWKQVAKHREAGHNPLWCIASSIVWSHPFCRVQHYCVFIDNLLSVMSGQHANSRHARHVCTRQGLCITLFINVVTVLAASRCGKVSSTGDGASSFLRTHGAYN